MKLFVTLLITIAAVPSVAAPLPRLTDDQIAIIYQQCLSTQAARLSHTDLSENAIYGAAYQACIPTQIDTLNHASNVVTGSARVKQLQADAVATFPEKTRRVREMRRQYEAQSGTSATNAPNQ